VFGYIQCDAHTSVYLFLPLISVITESALFAHPQDLLSFIHWLRHSSLNCTHCPAFVTLAVFVAILPSEQCAVTVMPPQEAGPAVKTPFELMLAPVPVMFHVTVPLQSAALYEALLFVVIVSAPLIVIA
jgi:hypothetical protein